MTNTDTATRIREIIAEKNRRRMLALRLYRPRQEILPFHLSMASERLIRGGVRGGKTVAAATEVASAATGIPLTDPNEMAIPFKYPQRALLIWIIGYDEKHIARLYRKLFRPGLFKIIKDRVTGKYRAWKPWEPDDAAREDDTKPSPPLISPEMIEDWAWDNKAERVFIVCRLKNGTEIHAFTSGGEAGQGEAVDVVWIDEDIKIPSHVEEWQARLSDVRGRLIWSAWPHANNEAIKRMTMRAEEQRERKNPDVEEWLLAFSENPYIPADEKRKRLEGWAAAGEAVVRARDRGEYADDYQMVFPAFNIEIVGIPRKSGRDIIETSLASVGFRVPSDWTRYLSLDPGHANAAVIFGAVPPPEIGKFLLIYDEVFAQRCDADVLAQLVAEKSTGVTYHAFVIDARAGRQTTLGSGKRVVEFYREAFARHGLKSRLTDSGFLPGSDDIGARNMTVRNWMIPRPDGTTLLRLLNDATPYTRNEFKLYKKRITRDDVTDKVLDKHNHLMDCLGYLAAYLEPLFDSDSAYFASIPSDKDFSPAVKAYEDILKQIKGEREDFSFHIGAGTVSAA